MSRSKSGITTLDCGCKCSDSAWTFECADHRRANNTLHIRASTERGVKPRATAVREMTADIAPAVAQAWSAEAEDAAELDAEIEARKGT